MAYSIKNSLFVRNLSPDVSEKHLREIFGECDEIESVTFKPYNTLSNQFFAQIDFATSKGVIEGNKLSGTAILGVNCVCGVIDPLASPGTGHEDGELSLTMDAAAIQAEFARRTKEAEDDQKFRTVHIKNVGMDMNYQSIRTLCKNFGEVDRLKVDEDDDGQRFALVEFRERGPAHVCKMQQQYLVNGRILYFMESETMVDEAAFAERTVQFEDTYLHAIAMRSQLTQPGQMAEKLKLVRAAAEAILPGATEKTSWGYSRDQPEEKKKKKKEKKEKKEGKEGKEKKDKKDKKEKKDKKKAKKERKRLQEQAAEGSPRDAGAEGNLERTGSGSLRRRQSVGSEIDANGRRRVRYKRKRRPGEKKGDHKSTRRKSGGDVAARGDASRSRSDPRKAELVEDESDGPIDLDEIEVVGTELVVMGSQSSSSSSSSSDDAEQVGSCSGPKGPIELDLDGIVNLDGEAKAGKAAAGKAAAAAAPQEGEEDAASQSESGESLA